MPMAPSEGYRVLIDLKWRYMMYTTGNKPTKAIRAIQSRVSGAKGISTRLMLVLDAEQGTDEGRRVSLERVPRILWE